jgi:secreted protein with Ig-like and vWFA domain
MRRMSTFHGPVDDEAPKLHRSRRESGRYHGDAAYGLLTLVPAAALEASGAFARDLIVLLDTSGSMTGAPIAQARAVVAALVESLGDGDRLELIAFADRPRRWRVRPAPATAAAREEARRWLDGLEAGGATEMTQGIAEALRPLRPDAQRQVVLVEGSLSARACPLHLPMPDSLSDRRPASCPTLMARSPS